MRTPRVFTINQTLAKHLAEGVHVGGQFVFLKLDEIDRDKVAISSAIHSAFKFSGVGDDDDNAGIGRTRLTIPLSISEKLSLPGVNVKAAMPPSLSLDSLTCDRDLYRCGKDIVNILVVELDSPLCEVEVELLSGNTATGCLEFERRSVRLNESGMGIVRFEDLPIGNYQAVQANRSRACAGCKFTVAGFELAPLVATIGQIQLRQKALSCTLHLSHFDKPLSGAVRVDLFDGTSRIDSRRTSAKQGLAIVALEIEGDGPHHLEIIMADDASATATIPLPGSEKRQREETVLTNCGLTTTASLMPGCGTSEALGLHVRQTDQDNSPIRLADNLSGFVRIEAMQDIEDCVVCTNRFPRLVEAPNIPSVPVALPSYRRLGNLSTGDVMEIETSDVAGLLSVGGFVQGEPWEARAVTLRRSDLHPSIGINSSVGSVSDSESDPGSNRSFEPGAKILVNIDLGIVDDGHAAVVIRDARLQPSSTPMQQLAANIKAAAAEVDPGVVDIKPIYGLRSGAEAYPHWGSFSNQTPAIDNETLIKLVNRGIISDSMADHVMESAAECGKPYYGLILDNGYADAGDIAGALADIYGYEFEDVDSLSFDETILELCPESVARENTVIPIREDHEGNLVFAISNPIDLETIEKLRFIFNRRIEVVIGTPDAIAGAINHFYGQIESESVDSMLQEFTDTAIDFTETVDAEYVSTTPNPPSAVALEDKKIAKTRVATDDAHVIFCKLVECKSGKGHFSIDLPDRMGHYTVDALVASGGQWSHAQRDFEASSDPYVRLQIPDALFDGDQAIGRVVARCQSGEFSIAVDCDGVPVTLHSSQPPYQSTPTDDLKLQEAEFGFVVHQGRYTATVCDRRSGQIRSDSSGVLPLGKLVQPRRTLRMLSSGESVELNDEIRRIRLLPSVQPIKQMVAQATANYEHLCCEQTAAKLFSAVICLANQIASGEPIEKSCTAIRVGLGRQRAMWLLDKGFATYLGQSPNDSWGRMATKHLMKMELVSETLETNTTAMALLGEIRNLADKAAKHYRMSWPSIRISDCEDAYALLRFGSGQQKRALDYIRSQVRKPLSGVRSFWRADRAMAIAGLLRGGNASDTAEAMRLANELFDQLGPEGRLYSTVDSVSLVVLLLELSRQECLRSDSRVYVNGQSMTIANALAEQTPVGSLRSDNHTCAVECLSYMKTDWTQFASNMSITVSLSAGGHVHQQFPTGTSVDLRVRIKKGYQAGDLIWVALPPCLSRIEGGGQVKQFAVDPQGASETVIRLAATAPSGHPTCSSRIQHFLVCVRNMYDEGRIGNPGPIPVQILG